MNAATIFKKTGLTPARLALAAVLAVSLFVVLIAQFGSGAEDEVVRHDRNKSSAGPRKQKKNLPAPTQPAPATAGTKIRKSRVWPHVDCDEATAFNPFVIPDSLAVTAPVKPSADAKKQADKARFFEAERKRREESRRRREAVLNELKSTGAQLILMSDEGPIAVIGDRRLRIGDTVEGLRVKDIGANGVVLVEIDQ